MSNLAGFEIWLFRDGAVVDRDHAANVLDGPLSAPRHLVGLPGVSKASAQTSLRVPNAARSVRPLAVTWHSSAATQ